uniref:hypothetical protein n=1 Tax=Actinotalea sp. TaxID=1872145 RepID=UPI0035645BBD
ARLASGTGQGSISDDELGLLYDQADALVQQYAGARAAELLAAQPAMMTRCTLDAADRLHALEVSPNGAAVYGDLEATPQRVARDPLIAVYPILDRFLEAGIS